MNLKLANEIEQAYALDLPHKASLVQQGGMHCLPTSSKTSGGWPPG